MKRSKRIISKGKGVTALVLTVISLAFMLVGIVTAPPAEQQEGGHNALFACWVYSMIVALISVFFYMLDGFASIGKAFKGILPGFNILSALLFLGAVPMAVFVGGGQYTVYWYVYYLFIFLWEIISVAKHKKLQKERQAQFYEAVADSFLYMN
ncbi:MAG: hypothetical protein E7659_02850 [Ruminococcaceae bacterium]|nr:hypothetical protein [Oscillospiraceae bacterium]